ncbi:Transposase [Shigella dysenteriae 1617]|uniref:Transposase n=1 Tax=Shigella dysenteriae 1617 TaxID=754093 RepID=A0A0A6ZT73_SHIDY|nr:Transposase [Shigella dysenteriae 1617]AHA64088.1 Transposase [Shigella dysenteriae 1617]AHA64358.1 Transposase [Shigella dysenteriae 1617]AHA64618.1 Transposase [Shigella dysenteriae 1617]AHA64801.1 Transposase [Shigella dysenteriae 1617]
MDRMGWPLYECCQLTDLVYDGVFEVLQWLAA